MQAFVDELQPVFDLIMLGLSWQPKLTSKAEVKKWCVNNWAYYKKYTPEVVDHFCQQYNIPN
ncbi:MAG TPA: hypothetical protein PKC55_10700 [Dysgonomonas sp.]|uniref:hypothetical protein n=1 Tax=unclassified Dysgonomonas TaxID=2630389 RepID=UPI0025BDE183|nr:MULTISPECIES: hypothetical protein [unclassified Dysgonomonas]HML65289.1 hypothetical protein [Dysgonomonas sp.]